jgi:hypothetical protein
VSAVETDQGLYFVGNGFRTHRQAGEHLEVPAVTLSFPDERFNAPRCNLLIGVGARMTYIP